MADNYIVPAIIPPMGGSSSGSVVPVNKAIATPQTNSIDLSSIINATSTERQSSVEAQGAITSSYASINDLFSSIKDSIQGAFEAKSTIDTQKELAALQAQGASQHIATVLGTNLNDSSELIDSLGMQSRQHYEAARQAAAEVHRKESTHFLDNPIQWLSDQITVNDDMENLRYHTGEVEANNAYLQQINALTQTSVVTQNAIAEAHTAATVKATADINKANADKEVAEADQKGLLFNVQSVEAVQRMKQQDLTNTQHLFTAITGEQHGAIMEANAASHLDIAMQNLKLAQSQGELTMLAKQELLDKRKLELSDAKDITDTVNKQRAFQGLGSIPQTDVLKLFNAKGDLGDSIRKQYALGSSAKLTNVNIVDSDPAEAALSIIQSKSPMSPAMKPLVDIITTAYKDAYDIHIKKGETKEQLTANTKATANGIIKSKLDAYAANIDENPHNPYIAPSLANLMAIDGIAVSPFVNNVLVPAKVDSIANVDKIISMAAIAIKEKRIDFNTAVNNIQNLYTAAASQNNAVKNFVAVGLQPQTSYNVNSNSGTLFKHNYDMTQSTDVSNYLSRVMRSETINTNAGAIGF